MQKMSWAERIVVDPEIHHGEPCIRGTRVPVAVVLGSLAQGLTPEEIIRDSGQPRTPEGSVEKSHPRT